LDVGGKEFRAGGFIGDRLAAFLAEYLNRTGSIILILTLLFTAIILSTQFSFGRFFATLTQMASERWAALQAARAQRKDEQAREQQRQEVIKKHLARETPAPATVNSKDSRDPKTSKEPVVVAKKSKVEGDVDAPSRSKTAALVGAAAAALKAASSKPTPPPIKRPAPLAVKEPPLPLPEPEKLPAERKKGAFTLPPNALLDAPKAERKIDERQLMDGARLLEEKCREFSVEGTVVQIHPGPVVTTYEFKPDAGVKYSKITGLADDLCLAMQAESVIIDRIPGKSTVGIQIPNPNREAISLRELLESDAYKRSTSKLTLAMGKTIHGEPFVSDLATMPHLLIAGSTGAGKSVSVNAMITSILMRATPDDVRFIMVDPKRLELGMYEDIPHLLTPVVMDPKLAANALRWAVREMEERYKTLAAFGVRNIEQYNRNVRGMMEEKQGEPLLDDKGNEIKPLPFNVVLIDELADLMMVAGNEVEESIARLAQMARAIGIHLVLATQRPSVDVITGLIKANLPARISFRVSSKIDSRTILDGNGAEQLLGKGDMLFLPPASSRFVRLHGPYISEQESARLASFLRKQGKPTYDTTVTADEKGAQEQMEFEKDELYDEAARIVVSSGQASISYLQRRLRIGFSRAARLVDMMEMDGLVSAAAGGKPREVLVKKDYFEEVDAQLR
jgi:S-DNA-T family DNA segregation ATPase FtsK/SpoIIIE